MYLSVCNVSLLLCNVLRLVNYIINLCDNDNDDDADDDDDVPETS